MPSKHFPKLFENKLQPRWLCIGKLFWSGFFPPARNQESPQFPPKVLRGTHLAFPGSLDHAQGRSAAKQAWDTLLEGFLSLHEKEDNGRKKKGVGLERLANLDWQLALDKGVQTLGIGGIQRFVPQSRPKPLLANERRYWIKGPALETSSGEFVESWRPCIKINGESRRYEFFSFIWSTTRVPLDGPPSPSCTETLAYVAAWKRIDCTYCGPACAKPCIPQVCGASHSAPRSV